jgi:hypothetical protein
MLLGILLGLEGVYAQVTRVVGQSYRDASQQRKARKCQVDFIHIRLPKFSVERRPALLTQQRPPGPAVLQMSSQK